MNTNRDLYLHLRARAWRIEVQILTDQCCSAEKLYADGLRPLTDAEFAALETDLERIKAEIDELEDGMSRLELLAASDDAAAIEERLTEQSFEPGWWRGS